MKLINWSEFEKDKKDSLHELIDELKHLGFTLRYSDLNVYCMHRKYYYKGRDCTVEVRIKENCVIVLLVDGNNLIATEHFPKGEIESIIKHVLKLHEEMEK